MYISLFKQRCYAFLMHLVFSSVLLAIALFLVYRVWYPHPLEIAMGVGQIYLILMVVDLILGPILTFIVYKLDKRKLFVDLSIILVLQLSAYVWGLYIMHQGKPNWLVFVKDDIELVSPISIREEHKKDLTPEFQVHLYEKPKWIAADYGTDPVKRQQLINDEMFDGISIVTRPEAYLQLSTKSKALRSALRPLNDLSKFNDQSKIEKELENYSQVAGWLPVKAPEQDMVALFNKQGQPLGIVNLKPW